MDSEPSKSQTNLSQVFRWRWTFTHTSILLSAIIFIIGNVLLLNRKGSVFIDVLDTSKLSRNNTKQKNQYCAEHVKNNGRTWFSHSILHVISMFDRSIYLLDVGANVGRVSIPTVACLRREHYVVSIEPVNENIGELISTAERIGIRSPSRRWRLARSALSDINGERNIFVPVGRGDNAALGNTASNIMPSHFRRAFTQPVMTRRGDTILKELNFRPDIIKIDVQGSEAVVVKGLETFLKSNRDIMVFAEQHRNFTEDSGFTPFEVYDQMKRNGFKAYCGPAISLRKGRFHITSVEMKREYLRSPEQWTKCPDIYYFKWKQNAVA